MKNSDSEEKIRALMALAKECGATVYAHRTSPHEPAVAFSPSAWEAFSARALAAIPAEPMAYCQPNDPINSTAFAWRGTAREERHSMALYAAPSAVQPLSEAQKEPYAWFWTHGREQGVLMARQDYEQHRRDYPGMTFIPVFQQSGGFPLPAEMIVTMYAEAPSSDAEMIEFAREIERAHGIKESSNAS